MQLESLSKPMAWLSVLVLLGGCASQQAMQEKPHADLPGQWAHATAVGTDGLSREWWRSFGSAELDAYVAEALAQSFDITAAAARVRQAQASATQAGAALLPGVESSASASRNARLGSSASSDASRFGVGLTASYEADFWGRNRAAYDAALAGVQTSEFDRETVRLTVTAAVANAWLQSRALEERIVFAQENLGIASRLLRWLEGRARAGAATALDLALQRGLVASQQRQLASLEQQADDARMALAVLLGRAQPPKRSQASDWDALREPVVNAGLPGDLLARRPDIARAEAQLAGADANVKAARAAMLPKFTLSAGIGTGGDQWRRALEQPLYNLAANLVAPIFDAGRLRAGTTLAVAQREELLSQYRRSIVAAWADVEVALNAVQSLEQQSAAQQEELAQARRALTLAERRQAYGADTLLPLLDAQRSLYGAQEAQVLLKLARLQARVGLYKALGGGWRSDMTTKEEAPPA